jgi:hypothetical protein
MSYSCVVYQPYEAATGKGIGPVSEYEDAAYEALLQETYRLQEIQDIEFETSGELAAAFVKTRCAVRFVRAERMPVTTYARREAGGSLVEDACPEGRDTASGHTSHALAWTS